MSEADRSDGAESVRPEALIAHIYGQIHRMREAGREPSEVHMSLAHYRLLEWYSSFMGEAGSDNFEYFGDYRIFGLEILIDDRGMPGVI